jgi:hypothetical protein
MPAVPLPLPARGLRRIRLDFPASAIETALVRASVGALREGRPCCRHCHRTPLVGERVHLYEARHRTEMVCELCRPLRVAAPDRTELVCSSERGASVQPVET